VINSIRFFKRDMPPQHTMIKLNTYLNFAGNTEEAFNFYQSVFGGEFRSVVRFKDMPPPAGGRGTPIAKEDEDKIIHIALPIGNDVLMASDAPESMGMKVIMGNNSYISVHPESKEDADRIFKALSTGGTIEMPITDQSWGDYYGSLKDAFGVQWMVNYTYPKE